MQYGKRITAVMWVLACVILFIFLLGIGQTQARYENVRSWKGIYAPEKPVLKSNFLAQDGRKVLLQDWDVSSSSYQTAGIRLVTDSGTVTGTLRCQSDSALITATLDEETLTVGKTENYATLMLRTTSEASALSEETCVTVRVSWEQDGRVTAWADFIVKLLPSGENLNEQIPSNEDQQVEGTLRISCPEAFALGELFPVKLTLPQGTSSVVLSYEGSGFPENTQYTVGGEVGCVLADEMVIAVPVTDQNEIQLLLDFSWAIAVRDGFFISATAYIGDDEIAASNATVSLNAQPFAVELDAAGAVLGENTEVVLPLTGDVSGLVWTLERLSQKDNSIEYTASDDLSVRVETTQNGTVQIVVYNENTRAPAGTYRLTVQRIFDGVILSGFEIPVFVCY